MKLWQKISLILFGLFLTIVILEISLRIGGFIILSIQEHRNLESIKQKGSCRIMCLGESTTQGQYPPYLEKILNQSNIGIKFSVIDKGIAGVVTTVILGQLESNLDKYQPDIVVVMMGINDMGSHMPYETVSASKIILTARSFRVYKLVRLLWLHMVTKLKEKGFYTHYFDKQKGKPKESYEKLRHLNLNDVPSYTELGKLYKEQGNFSEAEKSFIKAIELNPDNDVIYVQLGWFYREQRKFSEAEKSFKKAIEINSDNDSAYAGLGWLYQLQERYAESEETFRKAIEINSDNDSAYVGLGWLYKDQKKYSESEHSLKKAIELNSNNNSAYIELSKLYQLQKKYSESEHSLKKAIELDSNNECLYGYLEIIYGEIGNNELSEACERKVDNLIDKYYNPVTVNNYRMLKRILDKRKIKLVSVQYPIRSIGPLKKMFKEKATSIVFVDNEKIFKDAIRKEGYKEYFRDMFGGNFGHCTSKGNRLLAENIANVILKQIFGK